MKIYKHLWEKIVTIENFRVAYENATKGKKHYREVRMIEHLGPEVYLQSLLAEVKEKRYKVSNYEVFNLFTGQKWREIYKLPMKDRIVQHAVMAVIEPLFRESFIVDTYSSIKERGIHRGLARVKKALKHGEYHYYIKLDIHKCYPSLDKDILKQKLTRKFNDKDLQWLLNTIIDSCEHGVPIGNYTSQYFNNFYFSDFDHWMKEVKGVKGYFRYCDDIVILGKDKDELRLLMQEATRKLLELHVKVKSNYQIYSIKTKGIDFLGYITRQGYTRVRKHIKQSFVRKVSDMDLQALSKQNVNVLGSYWGIFVHADCRHLWEKYIGMKQFKDLDVRVHPRNFVRNLIGVSLTVSSCQLFQRRGVEWLRILCNYSLTDVETEEITEYNQVIVKTSAELLIEASKQLKVSDYPFETTIILNDKGFYEFT